MAEKVIFEYRFDQAKTHSCCGWNGRSPVGGSRREHHFNQETAQSVGLNSMQSRIRDALDFFERLYKELYQKDAD
jgi:hypothetical protein